ncbi:hypothetical protein P4H66_28320 [Paenibacillus dokdonensis]|uniref:Uncharacterized protein n=1 Tax=Paenibacillus dokdonensis TaxID=2567944 RepID=A0ABU6GWE8_9BACL|nr:hypothetical protein [Paenibacillus dokdonensis]MEC0243718.1 hypothetical protein [Paenibacillus dokdonensis]
MKSDRCQKNCCQSGSCSMSAFVETFYPVNQRDERKPLQDEGQARACSLPEIASLVELTLIGSMTKEEAILAADPFSIGAILRESGPFSREQMDRGAPERLLKWSDEVRSLKIFAENVAYPLEQSDCLTGTTGLLLLREDHWLRNGHLKEIFEEWALQYSSDHSGVQHPSIVLRERLLYRWKGHIETMLHHLDEGVLGVALVSGADLTPGNPLEEAYLLDLRDIQLEALFRAALACYRQGMENRLEILIPYPAGTEEWTHAYELIERVAEETLCHQRRAVTYRIGALMRVDVSVEVATDLARCADLLVLDCSPLRHYAHSWSESMIGNLEAKVESIRKVRPPIPLRLSGLQNAAVLPELYRMDVNEVSMLSEGIAAFRLAAAQLELQEEADGANRYYCEG